MLISVRNPDLYRAWLKYLGEDTSQNRADAYFKSQAGQAVPILA